MKKDKMVEVEKKEPELTKRQRIVNLVFTIIQIVLIVICVTASIFIIANPGGYAEDPADCNTSIMVVMSDSMEPTIETSDIIFGKKVPEGVLELGTVVTFAVKNYEGYYLNTHRIVGYYCLYVNGEQSRYEKLYLGDVSSYQDFVAKYPNHTLLGYVTRGDKYTFENNATLEDPRIWAKDSEGNDYVVTSKDDPGYLSIADKEVLAVWEGGKIGFVGKLVKFLQDPLWFALIILLPLVLLFGYNVFLIVKMIIADKTEKARKLALEEAKSNQIDEEEIKRKAIEEYLAKLEKEKEQKEE